MALARRSRRGRPAGDAPAGDSPATDVTPPVAAPAGSTPSAAASAARTHATGGAGSATSDRPLAGRRVLVPRTRPRAGLLAARLRRLGADAVEVVVSRPVPAADPGLLLEALPGADALILAGADEVNAVVALLRAGGRDVRALAGLVLVAVDDEAAEAFYALGLTAVRPSAQPNETSGPGQPGLVVRDHRITVAVSASAPIPVGALTRRRITLLTDTVTRPDPAVADQLRHGDLHAVAFASSTAARATAENFGPLPAGLLVAAMGDRTASACARAGIRVDAVATEPGIYPLADAVVGLLARRP
ncbi:MAG: uroporphyrinogen-III synthase, partial [Frankia sp.]